MRDPMDRSQRLTDGTRWRTFMRLLRLDDLMTSYTQRAPWSWAPRGGSRPRPQDSSRRGAGPRRCSALGIPARWLSARGIPTVVGLLPARRSPRDRFGRSGQGGAQTLKALHLEALLV